MYQLSCLDSLVGKSIAWRADGLGFKSHPRQPIFLWKMTVSGKMCCVALPFRCVALPFSISWSDVHVLCRTECCELHYYSGKVVLEIIAFSYRAIEVYWKWAYPVVQTTCTHTHAYIHVHLYICVDFGRDVRVFSTAGDWSAGLVYLFSLSLSSGS